MATKLPQYSSHQIVDILVHKYWQSTGVGKRAFSLGADRTLTYHDSGLPEAHQKLVRAALDAWSAVSGIKFKEVGRDHSAPQLKFVNDQAPNAAWAISYARGSVIENSVVNIGSKFNTTKPTLDSHWFKTYVHEIGHALGLGHAGYYEGNAKWGQNASYRNDTTLFSVMSYFAPKKAGVSATEKENPYYTASHGYAISPMMMDILAVQKLYGIKAQYQGGNSVYGYHSNVKGYMGQIFSAWIDGNATEKKTLGGNGTYFTIYDTGGYDTFDFRVVKADQQINLNQGTLSSVGGQQNNMAIAYNVLIEAAVGGYGKDKIIGNAIANKLFGRDGADHITGHGGNDYLSGGNGNDTLNGGQGNDSLNGGNGFDIASFLGATTKITVDLNITKAQNTGAGRDTLSLIEGVNGSKYSDVLKGNQLANILHGFEGNDSLFGRLGNDTLRGGNGNDKLDGGAGNDMLFGGHGADVFYFNGGKDAIYDFQDNVDQIIIAKSALGPGIKTVRDILAHAKIVNGDAVLNLGFNNKLIIENISKLSVLADDISII